MPTYRFIENIQSERAFFYYRGSVALYASLKAVGIRPGDEVILQAFTCESVPAAVAQVGATPVYVDIDPTTFNLDPGKVEKKVTMKTRAIIVQHTFGIPAEMAPILNTARKQGLWVIEDSCHALGSRYAGRETGTLGDLAFYSFGWHKPLVLGVGGTAVVNNEDLQTRMAEIYKGCVTPPLRELILLYIQYFGYSVLLKPSLFWFMRSIYHQRLRKRLYGRLSGNRVRERRKSPTSPVTGAATSLETETSQDPDIAGAVGVYDKRIVPFQKQRLYKKLDGFEQLVAHQRWVVALYEERLAQAKLETLNLDDHLEPVLYKYPLLFDQQPDIMIQARQARIELSNLFASPLNLQRPQLARLWRALGYQKGMCPISERISDKIVALPVHPRVKASDVERTIAFLSSFQ